MIPASSLRFRYVIVRTSVSGGKKSLLTSEIGRDNLASQNGMAVRKRGQFLIVNVRDVQRGELAARSDSPIIAGVMEPTDLGVMVLEEIGTERNAVKAVEKALDVLACFGLDTPELGLAEISAATGLSKATVHRLLGTLAMRKFVEQDPETSRYRLGVRLLELGAVARAHASYLDKAGPILRELLYEVDETVAVAVLDGATHVCTWAAEPSRPIRVTTAVGVRRPCYFGAAGQCLLAYQPEQMLDEILPSDKLEAFTVWSVTDPLEYRRRLRAVREQGYAIERGESFSDVAAVIAPIFDHRGRMVAAPGIIVPTHRLSDDRMKELLRKLLEATTKISQELGAPSHVLPDLSLLPGR